MKSERGAITLFVLVAMIFFVGIAMTAYISASSKLQGQDSEIAQIKASYGQDISEEGLAKLYDSITKAVKLDENGCYLVSRTIDGEAASSTNPIIPAGFKPINTNTSVWGEGESAPTTSNIKAGLVIEDKDGNQFVWVPVDGNQVKYQKHEYATSIFDDTSASTADTGNGNWKTQDYRNYNDWQDEGGNTSSVTRYGGFYIARYEAGIPENASFYGNTQGSQYITTRDVTTYIPVSKEKQPVWNFISQANAKTVAEKMYNTLSVKSSLIDSYAWDTVTTCIASTEHDVTNSTTWGNYLNSAFSINGLYAIHTFSDVWNYAPTYNKGTYSIETGNRIETATGASERNKAKNIYDLAGNVSEWTTETGKHGTVDTIYAVTRGGSIEKEGENSPISFKYGNDIATTTNVTNGFRVVLYVE